MNYGIWPVQASAFSAGKGPGKLAWGTESPSQGRFWSEDPALEFGTFLGKQELGKPSSPASARLPGREQGKTLKAQTWNQRADELKSCSVIRSVTLGLPSLSLNYIPAIHGDANNYVIEPRILSKTLSVKHLFQSLACSDHNVSSNDIHQM